MHTAVASLVQHGSLRGEPGSLCGWRTSFAVSEAQPYQGWNRVARLARSAARARDEPEQPGGGRQNHSGDSSALGFVHDNGILREARASGIEGGHEED